MNEFIKKRNLINQKGFALATLVIITGALSLFAAGAKVAENVYDKYWVTDRIAQDFQDQSEKLAKQVAKMGKGGDEAVKESMRLNQAAQDIKAHGLLVYTKDMGGEAVNLGKGLAAGKAMEGLINLNTRGYASSIKNMIVGLSAEVVNKSANDYITVVSDTIGIAGKVSKGLKTVTSPVEFSEDDNKLTALIQKSKTNVDDLDLAIRKAELDKIARMRGELKDLDSELQRMIREKKWAIGHDKQLEEARKQEAKRRAQARLNNAQNKNLSGQADVFDWLKKVNQIIKDFQKQRQTSTTTNQQPTAVPSPTPASRTSTPQPTKPDTEDFIVVVTNRDPMVGQAVTIMVYAPADFQTPFSVDADFSGPHTFAVSKNRGSTIYASFIGSKAGKITGRITATDPTGKKVSKNVTINVKGEETTSNNTDCPQDGSPLGVICGGMKPAAEIHNPK